MTEPATAYFSDPDTQQTAVTPAARHSRRWRILVVLILSLVIISLDNTILNVALPDIQQQLHASAADLQWVVDGYMLTFAALLLLAGNLGDRYGRRAALQFGLIAFAVGSAMAVFSHDVSSLLAARIVMGIGGAFVMPSTLSIVTNTFTGAERTKAVAIWTACAGIGVALGPVLGGALLEHFWWGSVFVINIPIVAVAFIAGARLIPESRDGAAGRPDKLGAALASVAFLGIVYGIISVPQYGWTSLRVGGSILLGLGFLTGFVIVEVRLGDPLLPMRFFHNRSFATAGVCITFVFLALYGALFLLTEYLQVVRGYSALAAGLRTIPVAIGLAAAAPRGPVLGQRFGNRRVVAAGLLVTAFGLSAFTRLGQHNNYLLAAGALVVTGLGMGVTMAPATDAIVGSVPPRRGGVASAVNDMVRQLGGALGVAVLGSALNARYTSDVLSALRSARIPPPARDALSRSVQDAHRVADRVRSPVGATIRRAADHAFLNGMHLAVTIAVVVLLAGAAAAFHFLPDAPVMTPEVAAPQRRAKGGRHRRDPDRVHRPPRPTAATPLHAVPPPATPAPAVATRNGSKKDAWRNRRTVRRVLLDVLGDGRLDLIEELYRPDVVDHDPFPGAEEGIDGVRYSIIRVREQLGEPLVRITALTAVDDLVVSRCLVTPAAAKPVSAVPASDIRPTTVVWRLVDGRIAERWCLAGVPMQRRATDGGRPEGKRRITALAADSSEQTRDGRAIPSHRR